MALLDLKREMGVEGTSAWILSADEFSDLLDLVYRSHFGEIWLYNNDLQILLDNKFFVPIYLEKIAKALKHNIDAVKILVSKECEHHVFPDMGGPSKQLLKQLKRIQRSGGKNRVRTFYFGRVRKALRLHPELSPIPAEHTWVFYTHRGNLRPPNYGIVLVRPSEFPFFNKQTKEHYAIAWQMTENHLLARHMQDELMACFGFNDNFFYFDDVLLPAPTPTQGLSPVSISLQEKRERQAVVPDTLAFGENADIAVLASRPDEIEHLKDLLDNVKQIPAGPDGRPTYECATIHTDTLGQQKVLLAVVGEGNLVAAGRTWDILSRWDPQHVILLGVAGIDPKTDKLGEIGDVIVAEKVVDYEDGSIMNAGSSNGWGFKGRGQKWKSDGPLFAAADKLCLKRRFPQPLID